MTLRMYRISRYVVLCLACLFPGLTLAEDSAVTHPRLLLTAEGIQDIRSSLGQVPLFDRTVEITKQEVVFDISEQGLDMWRGTAGDHFVRPKWGIYRSLAAKEDLRADEEVVRFADFEVEKVRRQQRDCPRNPK